MIINHPNLVEGLSLLAWRLQRDDELESRKTTTNFHCELETTPTSYAAFDYYNRETDHVDLCCEVNEEDYDPYEVFLRINTRRTSGGQRTSLTSHTSTGSGNFRNYNYADDDTPVKYPFAIGYVDRRTKTNTAAKQSFKNRGGQSYDDDLSTLNDDFKRSYPFSRNDNTIRRAQNQPFSQSAPRPFVRDAYRGFRGTRGGRPPGYRNDYHSASKRVTFADYSDDEDEEEESFDVPLTRRKPSMRSSALTAVQRFRSMKNAYDEDDEDIAPTVQEMDMLDYDDIDRTTSQRKPDNETKPTDGNYKNNHLKSSSYIGNMLPSFYDQLSESKRMLLQDATIDSSSSALSSVTTLNSQITTKTNENLPPDDLTKLDEQTTTSPEKATLDRAEKEKTTNEGLSDTQRHENVFITEQVEGPGGEEVIEEETRVQFRTRPTKPTPTVKKQKNDESESRLDNEPTTDRYRNGKNWQKDEEIDERYSNSRGRYYNPDNRPIRDVHRQRVNRFDVERDEDETYSSPYRRGAGSSPIAARQRYEEPVTNRRRPYPDEENTDDYPPNKRLRPNDPHYYSQSQQQVKNRYSTSPTDNQRQKYGQAQRFRSQTGQQHDYDDNDDDDDMGMQSGRVNLGKGSYGRQSYREPSYDREYVKRNDRLLLDFEEQNGLKMGEIRVFTPKLRLRISNVNVNWINIPPVPKLPNKMFMTRSEYDRGVNTFSPEGRLFQVEYAIEAIKFGTTAIGIMTQEGVVLATEKRITSVLVEPRSIEKIVEVDSYCGCAMSGLIADAKTLIDKARVEAQNHWFTHNERMSIESITQSVSNMALAFSDDSDEVAPISRPFGVALLFAGWDKESGPHNGPHLFHLDPSGTYTEYDAKAIGSGSEGADQTLQDVYHKSMKLQEACKHVLTILKQVMEEKLNATNVEMATVDQNGYRLFKKEEIDDIIKQM
ncbi:unnamed protein product [Didymodactylos carnosus]|uniref:Proteasome subunit alpha type-5 n=1 Tax=Didymodactylos carnosus TaxID=1234261 RepID=A0A814GBN3_9BILA|nr:unnamed protein product [Didymodactylos carnosus]CAF1012866.1 unnamed protein product [Didymodactylos carnosus]CAF3766053.1 unnamed protein product [Didymodactylos carnosus]CAF3781851.1 unnamed protein product [Didymodactylos carnosus]